MYIVGLFIEEGKEHNAEKLKSESKRMVSFPFVRIDLYDIDGKIYLSEFTFIPTGGFMRLEPEGTAKEWGDWLKL